MDSLAFGGGGWVCLSRNALQVNEHTEVPRSTVCRRTWEIRGGRRCVGHLPKALLQPGRCFGHNPWAAVHDSSQYHIPISLLPHRSHCLCQTSQKSIDWKLLLLLPGFGSNDCTVYTESGVHPNSWVPSLKKHRVAAFSCGLYPVRLGSLSGRVSLSKVWFLMSRCDHTGCGSVRLWFSQGLVSCWYESPLHYFCMNTFYFSFSKGRIWPMAGWRSVSRPESFLQNLWQPLTVEKGGLLCARHRDLVIWIAARENLRTKLTPHPLGQQCPSLRRPGRPHLPHPPSPGGTVDAAYVYLHCIHMAFLFMQWLSVSFIKAVCGLSVTPWEQYVSRTETSDGESVGGTSHSPPPFCNPVHFIPDRITTPRRQFISTNCKGDELCPIPQYLHDGLAHLTEAGFLAKSERDHVFHSRPSPLYHHPECAPHLYYRYTRNGHNRDVSFIGCMCVLSQLAAQARPSAMCIYSSRYRISIYVRGSICKLL